MYRNLGLVGLLIPILFSCSNDSYNSSDFTAGQTFTDSNLRVVLMDTITVRTSTIKYDSIVTSQSARILVGQYIDTVFGTIKSNSYMGMIPYSYAIDTEAEFDSIALYLKQDGYYYNDTLSTNTIRVKRLTKTLKPNDNGYLYNTSMAEYDDGDLALFEYLPRPVDSDTLEIRLDDDLGIDLFSKFQLKEITNADQFKDYFKGIALLSGETDNGSIIGFGKGAESCYIRLYYSVAEETDRVQSYLDIKMDLNAQSSTSFSPFFNQILASNPIVPLQGLQGKEVELESTDADNVSYIQSGVGIATKIQFPHIKTIYDIKGRGTILNAVLKIKPASGTFDDKLILRDSISIYIADRNNDITSQLTVGESTAVRGVLNRENEEFNDIYYEFFIGSYLEELLNARETDESLIFLPNNYNSTVDRFILNAMDDSQWSTVLEITYAIYDEED
jgi:hypothetical protein